MAYIAHLDRERGREQSLLDHLRGTAELAAAFAAPFGAEQQGYFAGYTHDVGKYSEKFQKRIRGADITVDHATAGAQLAVQHGDPFAGLCIAGHHGGLPDVGDRYDPSSAATLSGRLKRRVGGDLADYSAYQTELTVPQTRIDPEIAKDHAARFFFAHMLFSCLVDADWLDTEAFFNTSARTPLGERLETLLERLEAHIAPWWQADSDLNRHRTDILRAALEQGVGAPGLYALSAPTGAGKTVASVAFALAHALRNGLQRVIYVIPYVSILEQTKSVFEDIFGPDSVVAHYANVDFGDDERDPRRLATENWDAPIVLTTSVQFFESLFAHKPSHCRKLHNIAKSVVILDEAQMLPAPYLKPCVWALAQLVRRFGSTAVLCTATQPALDALLENYLPGADVREICPEAQQMHARFRRVRYERAGVLSNEALTGRLSTHAQVLCIVNSRLQARAILEGLPEAGSFHLTTAMTPEHRRRTLEEIHHRLKTDAPCRVVATSLIEAGVDVDFPMVYRELAGLDAIIQAGGRCNRNGKRPLDSSIVWIFESEQRPPRIFDQNIAAARHILREHADPASPEAVKAYFDMLYYTLRGEAALDSKGIMASIEGGEMACATIARRFRLIENEQRTVYIPLGEGAALVEQLRRHGPSRALMRKLGQYAVSVYPETYGNLPIEPVAEDAGILLDVSLYHGKTGLPLSVSGGQAYFT